MSLREVTLDDRFNSEAGQQVINGSQALLLALIRQRRFDRARGMNTAGFVSGYRGSPLSSVDTEAWRAAKHLSAADIKFVPGINEDLAMTAVAGTQQVALDPEATVDGVFAMWYGKGAGLDRTGDALRQAHGAGTSRHGGVLCVVGDDHALKSSSQAYHSEPTFIDMQMPVLYPADMQEMIDYAVMGWEMSRYSGCYVGMKVLAEHINATAIVDVGLRRIQLRQPESLPVGNDRWLRWPDPWPHVEKRLIEIKLPAALAYAKANGLNRVVSLATRPRLGIVTTGKSYRDVCQAFELLGLSLDQAAEMGISVYKIGMPWPVDAGALQDFCGPHETIVVVEEKRDLIEAQIRAALYSANGMPGPVILGRLARNGSTQFSNVGELGAIDILQALSREVSQLIPSEVRSRLDRIAGSNQVPPSPGGVPRTPYFCSGCPHNSSTILPDGSRALAGVGCHFMATGMDRETTTLPQMGGEGVSWIGTAPFTRTSHVFVNLGEGTYFHSGVLAIRAAVAAKVNATYKILFNDAIAMTGGQPVEGELNVPIITRQLRAEGVEHIEVVAEDVTPYRDGTFSLPEGVSAYPRSELDTVQRRLREVAGVTAIVFDQVCATEKRRRRKRAKMPKAPERVLINSRVCEGCGDCSVKSNCMSVVPIETELGRKRAIDQFNCNQDVSCVQGFCPSFVTVPSELAARDAAAVDDVGLSDPSIPQVREGESFEMLIAGVGGTGIITVGAILGMAAHLERKPFTIYDKLGMAQKYGAVHSHLRIASREEDLTGIRIVPGQADLMLAGDLGVAAQLENLELIDSAHSRAVVALDQAASGAFVLNPELDFGTAKARSAVQRVAGEQAEFIPARRLALEILGDEVGANLLLVGYAWQRGLVPLSRDAVLKAVEMNGVEIALNVSAFNLGRRYAMDPERYLAQLSLAARVPAEMSWEEVREHRIGLLTEYQDAAYARRYADLVNEVAIAEAAVLGHSGSLAHAVATGLAKLMSYKDEYEVARLFTDGAFRAELERTFGKNVKPNFHLAPPVFGAGHAAKKNPRKMRFGPGTMHLFRLLTWLKRVRGTRFDLFGYNAERRMERGLIEDYVAGLRKMLPALTPGNHGVLVRWAAIPERIRGFGHIKLANAERAAVERDRLQTEFFLPVQEGKVPSAA